MQYHVVNQLIHTRYQTEPSTKATLNHDKIGETLSEALAQVSGRAAACENLLSVVKTDFVRTRLADIYANVFFFFRDVMEWYLKSRISRFLNSFNDRVCDEYNKVVTAINDDINAMFDESKVAGL